VRESIVGTAIRVVSPMRNGRSARYQGDRCHESRFFKRIFTPGLLSLALFAVLLLATIDGGSDASTNNGIPGFERAIAAQEAHNDLLLSLDGVVGTGNGAEFTI